MDSVLVTGASGFIGRHLVDELFRRGIRVRCFARSTSIVDHLANLDVEIVRGDLLDISDMQRAVSGVDVVFHLAGLTHAINRTELHRTNAVACGVLADACLLAPTPPTLVCVSSLAAAGPASVDRNPIREQDVPRPVSNYGRSKRRGEIELQKRASDLPCTVIRPGIALGPFDPVTIPLFRSVHRFRLHVVVGFQTPPLSLIFVEDLVRLLVQAAQYGERLAGAPAGDYSPEGYYFACDDSEHPTYWELGHRIAAALDRSVFVWPLWRWGGRVSGGVCQMFNRIRGRSSILNLDKIREATVSSWACSAKKARRQLDFTPAQDLDAALKKTASWYLASLKAGDRDA